MEQAILPAFMRVPSEALKDVELVGVCDTNLSGAQAFAADWGVSAAFDSLEIMLRNQRAGRSSCARSRLTNTMQLPVRQFDPEPTYFSKSRCVFRSSEADDLLQIASDRGLKIGVNHNFLYSAPMSACVRIVRSGSDRAARPCRIQSLLRTSTDSVRPVRLMDAAAPGNVVLEVGPHLVSAYAGSRR